MLSICFTSHEGYSWATLENFFDLQCVLSLRTFSHTQPLQWNPRYNTGYIRLNIITIKFSTELKPTQNSCKLQLYKNGQTQKKFDFGNLFIFLSRPRETPHLERERAHTFFFFFWGGGGVVISCFGDSYPFYSLDYIIIFSGMFSYFYYYNTNEKSFLQKLLGSLVIFFF